MSVNRLKNILLSNTISNWQDSDKFQIYNVWSNAATQKNVRSGRISLLKSKRIDKCHYRQMSLTKLTVLDKCQDQMLYSNWQCMNKCRYLNER